MTLTTKQLNRMKLPDNRITIPLDNAICPKCKVLGQRKYRRGSYKLKTGIRVYNNRFYEYFDHYKHPNGMNNYHGKFLSSCYIGKVS